jgi:hypothetical protein
MNDLKFACRQLLKNPGFTLHPPNTEHLRRGSAEIRMKSPNPKTQIPNKLQTSISTGELPQRGLELDAWDFFGAWVWGLGIWPATDKGPLTTHNQQRTTSNRRQTTNH